MFSLSGAILAGFIGTALMTISIYAGKLMGLSFDMPRTIGLMFVDKDSRSLYVVGLLVHFLIGAVFAIFYALIFWLVGATQSFIMLAAWGTILGALHGVGIGAFMGVMPQFHPRTGPGMAIEPPGYFGRNYGIAMPMGIVVMHMIFGAVFSVVYGLLTL